MAMRMLESLLNDGWSYHDRESERLAGELEAIPEATPELLAPFIHLAVHTIGEHMRDWPRAYALGRNILRGHEASRQTAPAWERLYAAAIMCADSVGAVELELAALDVADTPVANLLAMRLYLAEALASADRIADACRILPQALDVASRATPTPVLDRAVAMTGNNLAWILHDLPTRSAAEDILMGRAAEASLTAWRRCGSWINEELALYLGARVAHARGEAALALHLADAGLQVIAANGRRPFDTARFHLLRATVLTALQDPVGCAQALAAADAAGEQIAFEELQEQYAAARAQLSRSSA